MKKIKTNAMRLLDEAHIPYEVFTYDIDPEDFDGLKVSELIGVDPESCFKTLSLKCDKDLFILCIPVKAKIDLKKSARALGVKHLSMIKVKDLLKEVGYTRGATTPIGILKKHRVAFDIRVSNYEKIEISGGKMGISLLLESKKLIAYLGAEVKDLCEVEE